MHTLNHISKSRDLSKQFWCLVDGTKNSILISFIVKHPDIEPAFKLISLLGFFHFKLFFFSSKCKKANAFQKLYLTPWIITKNFMTPFCGWGSTVSRLSCVLTCQQLIVKITAPWDLHLLYTTFENSIFVQNRTLLKLLGWMPDYNRWTSLRSY